MALEPFLGSALLRYNEQRTGSLARLCVKCRIGQARYALRDADALQVCVLVESVFANVGHAIFDNNVLYLFASPRGFFGIGIIAHSA